MLLHRNFIVFLLNYLAGFFMIEVELSLALYVISSSCSMQSIFPVLILFASNTILNQESSRQLCRRCVVSIWILSFNRASSSVVEFESLSEELETRRLSPIEAGRMALPIKVIKPDPEKVARPQLFFVRHSNLNHNEAQRITYRPGLWYFSSFRTSRSTVDHRRTWLML
jgi:hypothetical protein